MELPYDIWLHIARFLPAEHVRRLYCVNHAWYDIAMDERYRSVSFQYWSDPETQRNLRRLREPSIARRVRNLSFHPALIGNLLVDDPQNSAEPWSQKFRSKIKYLRSPAKSVKGKASMGGREALEAMLQIVGNLSNVTTYNLEFWARESLSALRQVLPVLTLAWKVFGDKLTSLTLDIPLDGLQDLLHPSLRLRRLTSLTLRLTKSSVATDSTSVIRHLLVPFVNQHHATLTTFVLTSFEHFDFSAFLLGLHHFPYLSKLTISHPFVSFQQSDTLGLRHVLAVHSAGLRELNLRFHTPLNTWAQLPSSPAWYGQEFFGITFSGLEVLDLGLRDVPEDVPWTINYLRNFRQSLTSLTLRDYHFSFQEAATVANLFTAGFLQKLDIAVDNLYPQLIDVFADRLPVLSELYLVFESFLPADGVTSNESLDEPNAAHAQFCADMQRRRYTNWGLRHLTAFPTGGCDQALVKACETSLVEAIPSLHMLNGRDVQRLGTLSPATRSLASSRSYLTFSSRAASQN
ncbi:hypothetical protein BDN72DRAFT_962730 [Pluteus cervinus]|uniref:Uncharacterized protein n=1 Tax=Pluteus cervinus TaxID=181527 RepID=A0ACD3AGV0_9AGAR|nr:hypothetical protein BDN72DRAFT_962730 [Pluteus cervinus]